ncbi:MAG: DUF3054 family protein [Haloferacaceae archaeon]|jgi:hypothetical protein
MADDGFLARRIDPGAWPLAVADVVALVVVFTGGAMQHNGPTFPVDEPAAWLLTILPFLLGWLLVGPLVGVYSAGAAESAKAAVPLAVRAWVPAAAVAVGVRALAFDPGPVAPVFAVITLVTGAVGLGIARWLRFRF